VKDDPSNTREGLLLLLALALLGAASDGEDGNFSGAGNGASEDSVSPAQGDDGDAALSSDREDPTRAQASGAAARTAPGADPPRSPHRASSSAPLARFAAGAAPHR
jgi:hypothetical protein